jgi:hypothetical protein
VELGRSKRWYGPCRLCSRVRRRPWLHHFRMTDLRLGYIQLRRRCGLATGVARRARVGCCGRCNSPDYQRGAIVIVGTGAAGIPDDRRSPPVLQASGQVLPCAGPACTQSDHEPPRSRANDRHWSVKNWSREWTARRQTAVNRRGK